MYGNLDQIATGPLKAIRAANSTCVGIGISPEGIEQNPVVYELMLEVAWQALPTPTHGDVTPIEDVTPTVVDVNQASRLHVL